MINKTLNEILDSIYKSIPPKKKSKFDNKKCDFYINMTQNNDSLEIALNRNDGIVFSINSLLPNKYQIKFTSNDFSQCNQQRKNIYIDMRQEMKTIYLIGVILHEIGHSWQNADMVFEEQYKKYLKTIPNPEKIKLWTNEIIIGDQYFLNYLLDPEPSTWRGKDMLYNMLSVLEKEAYGFSLSALQKLDSLGFDFNYDQMEDYLLEKIYKSLISHEKKRIKNIYYIYGEKALEDYYSLFVPNGEIKLENDEVMYRFIRPNNKELKKMLGMD